MRSAARLTLKRHNNMLAEKFVTLVDARMPPANKLFAPSQQTMPSFVVIHLSCVRHTAASRNRETSRMPTHLLFLDVLRSRRHVDCHDRAVILVTLSIHLNESVLADQSCASSVIGIHVWPYNNTG